ncbi:MAG: hypothetical protein KC431_31150, partial [Myxococcales bacterium]|nr:hypothetical protein [Myxococcales bacterium]
RHTDPVDRSMTRRATRPVALALVAALTWTSTPVEAAPPTETRTSKTRGKRAQEPAQPDPAILEQARALSDEAFLRFDTRDYAGAVSLWREAGELLPLDPLYAEYRRHFAIQIAYAYKQSYTFSGEPGELAAAREQFEAYRESLPVDDEANRQLITDELEELDTLAEAAAYEASALRQQAYDDYLAAYVRPHGGFGVYRNNFAIGRESRGQTHLQAFEVLEGMGYGELGWRHHRLRKMSIAGLGLAGGGFLLVLFTMPFAVLFESKAAGGVAAGGGVLLATGIGMGVGGLVGMRRTDIDGKIEDYNERLARELGLIESPSHSRPRARSGARLRRFEQATGFRLRPRVQGLQL